MEKAQFIPPASVKVSAKDSDAVAYIFEDRLGRPCAHVYVGKQSKPVERCYYRSVASREAAVRRVFEWRAKRAAEKAERSAAKKAWQNPYKVGDIFVSSWGYDQTNVDYFEAVEVKGKKMVVRAIAGGKAQADLPVECGRIVPLPGAFIKDHYKGGEWTVMAQEGGFRSPVHGWASYMEPKMIAGVPTYNSTYWSAYA